MANVTLEGTIYKNGAPWVGADVIVRSARVFSSPIEDLVFPVVRETQVTDANGDVSFTLPVPDGGASALYLLDLPGEFSGTSSFWLNDSEAVYDISDVVNGAYAPVKVETFATKLKASSITDLEDTPAAMGAVGQGLKVDGAGTALEWFYISPSANVINVSPSGKRDYTSIKDACDAAAALSPTVTNRVRVVIHSYDTAPGYYVELPFTIPQYVTLMGSHGYLPTVNLFSPMTMILPDPSWTSGTFITVRGALYGVQVYATGTTLTGAAQVVKGTGLLGVMSHTMLINGLNAGTHDLALIQVDGTGGAAVLYAYLCLLTNTQTSVANLDMMDAVGNGLLSVAGAFSNENGQAIRAHVRNRGTNVINLNNLRMGLATGSSATADIRVESSGNVHHMASNVDYRRVVRTSTGQVVPMGHGVPVAVQSGTTAQRPTPGSNVRLMWFDNTLGRPIWWNGTGWRDATGAAV